MTPTVDDAAARSVVRLPDGRTGRLLWIPAPGRTRRSKGLKARVMLREDVVLSVPVDQLQVVP
jgi:hypothetical protein